jgi:hypothetical protein
MKHQITNKEDYKLEVELHPAKHGQHRLVISRWIDGYAWTHTELYLTPEELDQLRSALQGL